jgi:cysteine desulfurase
MPADGGADVIDLDHNATTPIDPAVLDAMWPFLAREHGNPSSDHALGRRAKAAVDTARAEVASLIGAQPDEIVFTSGGTEADHLAVRGVAGAAPPERRELVISAVEHPAVNAACAAAQGFRTVVTPVTPTGVVDLAALERAVHPRTALVSVMLANNETGVIQPVAAVAGLAHAVGAPIHTDAAQAAGKIPIDVDELGVDLLTIAGHKLYAPKGVGALYVRRGTALRPVVEGGGQEHGRRAGTEAVHQLVGLGVAARVARERLAKERVRIGALRDRLQAALVAALPGLTVTGSDTPRLPNTLHVVVPGVRAVDLLPAVPEVAASAGAACHAGEDRPSVVLLAMGVDARRALGAVRLSLGRGTTESDVDHAARLLATAARRLSRP